MDYGASYNLKRETAGGEELISGVSRGQGPERIVDAMSAGATPGGCNVSRDKAWRA